MAQVFHSRLDVAESREDHYDRLVRAGLCLGEKVDARSVQQCGLGDQEIEFFVAQLLLGGGKSLHGSDFVTNAQLLFQLVALNFVVFD